MSSKRTLEDHFCKRNLLHLQGGGKTQLVYPETKLTEPVRVWMFWSMPTGKVGKGRGRELEWFSGVGIVLRLAEDL